VDKLAIVDSGDSFTMSAFITETRVDRRLVRIPKDQKQLLDRDDAWTADSFMDVPPGVLEDVRRFHSQKQKRTDSADAHSSSSDQQVEHVADERPSLGHSSSSSNDAVDDIPGDDEDAGTPIEWSQSPEPRDAGNQPAVQQRNNVISSKHLTTNFPSSSLAEEADLDIEVPGAITDVVMPVQQRAKQPSHLDPTPPSAQAVPSTYPSTAGQVEDPEPKKRRRMKVPKFDEDPTSKKRGSAPPDGSQNPEIMVLDDVKEGSPPPSSSPPFPGASSSRAEGAMNEAGSTKPAQVNRPEDTQLSDEESSDSESEDRAEITASDHVDDHSYYATFKEAYPDYSSSLSIFVRGVMCLQDVNERRALPAFLFDDFIRVFSHEFMIYIAGLDDDAEPLTALQYYNEKVDEPIYTKRIVMGQNLMAILEAYKQEANEASLLLSLDEEEQGSEDGGAEDHAEDPQAMAYSGDDRGQNWANASLTRAYPSSHYMDESPQQLEHSNLEKDAIIIESTSPESPGRRSQPVIEPETGKTEVLASQLIPETVVATRQKRLESPVMDISPRQKSKRSRKSDDPDSRSKRYKQFLQTDWTRRVASSSAAR
jgi:hypothetical protein